MDRYRRLARERKLGPTQFIDAAPNFDEDTLWRGLTREGEVRLLAVRATTTVQEAVRRLECSADVGRLLGELMVATLLVRSTLNPEERMQVFLNHRGPTGQIVVDAWDTGGIRAFVANPQASRKEHGFLIGEGTLQVTRSRGNSERSHRSTMALQGEGVVDNMMHYLLESEQILSLLRVEMVQRGDVQSAVGLLVQLMPEGTREDLQRLVGNLQALPGLTVGMTAEDPDGRAWAEGLMDGFHWDQCAREAVRFQCRCSEERILSMLATLPRADIAELARGTDLLEMTCDYCKTGYKLKPTRVALLLQDPS